MVRGRLASQGAGGIAEATPPVDLIGNRDRWTTAGPNTVRAPLAGTPVPRTGHPAAALSAAPVNLVMRRSARLMRRSARYFRDVNESVGSLNIVRAVVALAKGLGMETTAEGIETQEQLRTVRAEGCRPAQCTGR